MVVETRVDPVRLAEFTFGHQHWDIPQAIMRDLFNPNARVAVKACHASSKTFTAADCVLLALLLGGDVITTAPTWAQVEAVLWAQVRRAIMEGSMPVPEWGNVNLTDITLPTGEFALGISTNEAVRLQGFHARPGSFLLIIFDEAPGVRPDIYEAVEGISAGGDVRLLYIGNPVEAAGPFYDIYASDSGLWRTYTIDAFDTPNLRGLSLQDLLDLPEHDLDVSKRPYLVTRRWVRDRYLEWGPDHPLWQARVRGEFPEQSDSSLFSLVWCRQAEQRALSEPREKPLIAGIDVAGPGEDETVVYLRRGRDIVGMRAWTMADSRADVQAWLFDQMHHGLKRINVDAAGLGWHFYLDLLAAFGQHGVEVRAYNAASASETENNDGDVRFANLKAEQYWAMRDRFAAGDVAGLTDQTTISQLVSIRWKHDRRGRVLIEAKEDAAKRGVKSPDRAEALILAFAPDNARVLAAKAIGAQSQQRDALDPWRAVQTGEQRDRAEYIHKRLKEQEERQRADRRSWRKVGRR